MSDSEPDTASEGDAATTVWLRLAGRVRHASAQLHGGVEPEELQFLRRLMRTRGTAVMQIDQKGLNLPIAQHTPAAPAYTACPCTCAVATLYRCNQI